MNVQQQTVNTVIVGLGTTGLSVARYLANQNKAFAVVDSRENPPCSDELYALEASRTSQVTHHFGDFDTPLLGSAKQLVVNPGIAITTPEISKAHAAGAEVIGDIELFARDVKATKPVVAITGSNGKTTVTSLLDLMAKKSGVHVGTGGNIGTPALDLLGDDSTELFVLELSSYQLETTPSLLTVAAVILNISDDHLDRYDNQPEKYARAKAAIYKNCDHIIYNREDFYSTRFANEAEGYKALSSFGLNKPESGDFGLQTENDVEWLAKGEVLLMPATEVKQAGRHNLANSLAALALGDAVGLDMSAMLEVLKEYPGMIHRTQWVTEINGVNWYNDSKGTNVGATVSALSGLPGKTVLIAGGQGKGADFLPLASVIKDKARALVLMGEDALKISRVADDSIPQVFVKSMQQAVEKAYSLANTEAQDNVLLSPACASFDMFENYADRGLLFIEEVEKLERKLK